MSKNKNSLGTFLDQILTLWKEPFPTAYFLKVGSLEMSSTLAPSALFEEPTAPELVPEWLSHGIHGAPWDPSVAFLYPFGLKSMFFDA